MNERMTHHAVQSDGFHEYCVHAAVLQACSGTGFCPAPAHLAMSTAAVVPASTHVMLRDCVPPPHSTEHEPKSPASHSYVGQA